MAVPELTLVPVVNTMTIVHAPAGGGAFTLPFTAPTGSGTQTYVLQRKLSCDPGGEWEDISSLATPGGLITFVDAGPPCGAIYRVRRIP